MKNFLAIFVICFVLCVIFLFLGGAYIFENIWAMIGTISLVMALVIGTFIHQEMKIEKLEERIAHLEGTKSKQNPPID